MNTSTSRLIKSPGWDACLEALLLKREENWQNSLISRDHGHTLRRLFEDIQLDAVLCLEARPTVCIKDARNLSDLDVEAMRKKLWNLGATTLLIVERQTQIQLFSTLTKPMRPDEPDAIAPILSPETIDNLAAVELALRLRHLIRRIETGAIYRDYKPQFDATHSIDGVLLTALGVTRDLLCPQPSVNGYRRTHALIGRFLFSCYLIDRGIIGESYLTRNNLPPATDMLRLLAMAKDNRAVVLLRLFAALHRDFNGSLFGEENVSTLEENEVEILHRFLAGEDLNSGQLALGFKLYDFSFVPVELISSIYQAFLGAEAEAETISTGRSRLRNHGQRRLGAYYTPPRLAELAVAIATERWTTLLNKRCLDPACGSGIFLVIIFVRMAEEWRRKNPNARTQKRYNELLRLLAENISGVDVEHAACLVACFSLYLAFLDQMEPKEIDELRELLNRDSRKILPRILWERNRRSGDIRAIRELDFFELSPEAEYDLVIGNPPWISRKEKESRSAAEWTLSEQKNPAAKGIARAEASQSLLPAREVACGFMWKVGLHLKPNGVACQILPSRVFLSNNTDQFQSHWIKRHRIESVWLLADYRFILFPGANCPSFIACFRPRAEGEALGEFQFITPKVDLFDPREALIVVAPEDQKTLSEEEIVRSAVRQESASAWKKQHWGTPRDVRLIERLMRLPKLSRLAGAPPRTANGKSERVTRWFKGQGFRPATASTTKPEKVFWKPSDLFLSANSATGKYVLFESDCEKIGHRFPEGLDRSRNPLIYKAPLLLINKACTKFLFSDFDVLFQDDFQSISAPKADEDELLFLTAVFGSPLALYVLFHTTANFGIEREIARVEEMLELPFPLPSDTRNEKVSRAIIHDCAAILRQLTIDLSDPKNLLRLEELTKEAKRKLDGRVYKYFEISDWERKLIEDTANIFRRSSTPPSFDSPKLITAQPAKAPHREAYASTLVDTFRAWTRSNVSISAATTLATKAGLAVLTMTVGGKGHSYQENEAEDQVNELLTRLRKVTVGSNSSSFRCLKGFVFFEGRQAHILKPLNRRSWTHTAALNDADEIIGHMMQEDGWHG